MRGAVMKGEIKYCTSCAKTGRDVLIRTSEKNAEFVKGFIFTSDKNVNNCPHCGMPLCDVPITIDDFATIRTVSNYNRELLEAMIALKEKDIIEYELKMSQFRNQAQQIEQTKPKTKEKPITCPKCGSTSIISGTRGFTFTTGFFGSGNYRKVCENCGYKWKPGSLSESFDRAWFGNK